MPRDAQHSFVARHRMPHRAQGFKRAPTSLPPTPRLPLNMGFSQRPFLTPRPTLSTGPRGYGVTFTRRTT